MCQVILPSVKQLACLSNTKPNGLLCVICEDAYSDPRQKFRLHSRNMVTATLSLLLGQSF